MGNAARKKQILLCIVVAAINIAADRITKLLAVEFLKDKNQIELLNRIIVIGYTENTGAFLSLGASLPQAARSALTIGAGLGLAFLLAYLVRAPRLRWSLLFGLALVWAGGTSNLIDRFARHGEVTDFMVVRVGPLHTGVFNFADFAIVAGVLIAIASVRAAARKLESHLAENGTRR